VTGSTATVKGIVLVQTADAHGARVRDALGAHPELEILDEVPTTLEAVAAAGRLKPGVLVLDVRLEDVAGHGVLRSVRAVSPHTRIVVHAWAVDVADVPGTRRWLGQLTDAVVDPGQAAALDARLVLPEELASVPLSRRFAGDLLAQWDLDDLAPTVGLVVSELVANAVQHVGGPCALELTHGDQVLRVAVADRGRGMPDLQVLGATNQNGRGLHIISAFASSWGVDHLDDGGKLVWAELDAGPEGTT
jgi:anti-sigma regulatory factor (Ser/Thr protein kinase)